jgi:cardiolipin synthase
VLARTEAGMMAWVGAALVALTLIGILWPPVLAAPIVVLAGWIGIALLARAFDLKRRPAEPEDTPEASRGARNDE